MTAALRSTEQEAVALAAAVDRRKVVDERLRALGPTPRERLPPPPQGQLGADELLGDALHLVLAELGPVFADFGRYLSSRIDLLPRRICLQLATIGPASREPHATPMVDLLVDAGTVPPRRFFAIEPEPSVVTNWTQQHAARLSSNIPVTVTIVRPDAARVLDTDLPLLSRLGPWLKIPPPALAAAIDDFSQTLRRRLDQVEQSRVLLKLAEDARAGGGFHAPVCYPDFCATNVLTTERIGGVTAATVVIDRPEIGQRLASAWMRQAMTGQVVPFDFDLRDVKVYEGRLVLVGGALELLNEASRDPFVRYMVATAADDPDGAWDWIAEAAVPDADAQTEYRLRRRLRQAAPFRDGEWSGDDRLAEQLLVQWRVAREAGWGLRPHQLHLFRAVQAISTATTQLAPDQDVLLEALREERWRLGLAAAQPSLDPRAFPSALDTLLRDAVQLPQKLDEVLTLAASGRLRVKLHVPDAEEGRRVRNGTVSLVASLVTLVSVAFLVRHLAPAYGADVEKVGAVLLLIIGAWLLVAAARL